MEPDIYQYFLQKQKNASFISLHVPNFQTKEQVDKWFNTDFSKYLNLKGEDRLPDDDDDF